VGSLGIHANGVTGETVAELLFGDRSRHVSVRVLAVVPKFISGVIARIVRRGESRKPVKNFAPPSLVGLKFFERAGGDRTFKLAFGTTPG
jgi:hypothetical protein